MAILTETKKKQMGQVVGRDLTKHYGQQKFYTQKQVKTILDRKGFDIDIHCWDYCLFMDHTSFDAYHQTIGESCNYLGMKESMVSAVTDHQSDSWLDFDFDLSWFEWPDIELPSIFDFIDF